MSTTDTGSLGGPVPSVLDLVRLSRRRLFPPGGKDLYRQIGILTEMGEEDEVLVASCGEGTTLDYFAAEFGARGSGVEEDPALVEVAEAVPREGVLREKVQYQQAPMRDLPYRDGVFDIAVGEIGLTSRTEPQVAIRELVRVVRPGGRIVLVQLVWKAPVDRERQALLASHLGARPVMLVELKRMLKELGVTRLHTEAWSDEETAFRRSARKPFPDFAELFGWPEKAGILRRAWGRWGWRGVAAAIARQREVHRLLTKERVLGLDMIVGTKAEELPEAEEAKEPSSRAGTQVDLPIRGDASTEGEATGDSDPSDPETQGLPLFIRKEES